MAVHLSLTNAPTPTSPAPSPSSSAIPNAESPVPHSQLTSSPVRRSARLHHTSPPANIDSSASSSMLKPSSSPNNDASSPNPRKRTRSECGIPPAKMDALKASTASPSPSPTRKSARLSTHHSPPTPSPTPRVKRQKVSPAHASRPSPLVYGGGTKKSPSPDYKSRAIVDPSSALRRKRKENAALNTTKDSDTPTVFYHKPAKKPIASKGKEKELPTPPETPMGQRRSLRNRDVLIPSPAPTPLSAHRKPTPNTKGKGAPQNPLTLSPTFVGQAPHIPSPLSPHGSLSSLNNLDNIATPPSSPTRGSVVDFELDLVDMGVPALALPSPLSGNVLVERKPSSSTLSSPLSSPPQSPPVTPQPSLSSIIQSLAQEANQGQGSEAPSISPLSPIPPTPIDIQNTSNVSRSPSITHQPPSPQSSPRTPIAEQSSLPASPATFLAIHDSDTGDTQQQLAGVDSDMGMVVESTYSPVPVPMADFGFQPQPQQQQNQGFDSSSSSTSTAPNVQFVPVSPEEAQVQNPVLVPSVEYVPVVGEGMYQQQQQQQREGFEFSPMHHQQQHQQQEYGQDTTGFHSMPFEEGVGAGYGASASGSGGPSEGYANPPPAPQQMQQVPMQDMYMPPQPVWWEQPPDVTKEPLWKGACKIRVWDIRRRYSPETIRSVVAQEAHDYYQEHGFPLGYGSPSPPSSRSNSPRHDERQGSADGFMDEEYYDFELREDEDMEIDEDEDEEDMEEEEEIEREVEEERRRQLMLSAPVKRPSGLRQEIAVGDDPKGEEEIEEGDEDAEGDMEVDIAPYEDPSFNPELSSPTSPSGPPSPLSPGETLVSSFYVPVVPPPLDPSSPSPFAQTALPQAPLQIHIPPGPILPLPPPPLASVRVYALRSLELGSKIMGRGTPIDKTRTSEWGRVWRLKAESKANERRMNTMAFLYGDEHERKDGHGVKLHLPTNEEMRLDHRGGGSQDFGDEGPGQCLDADLKPPASSPFHEWGALLTEHVPSSTSQAGYLRPSSNMDGDRSSAAGSNGQERFMGSSSPPSASVAAPGGESMMNMGMNMFNIFGWFGGDMPWIWIIPGLLRVLGVEVVMWAVVVFRGGRWVVWWMGVFTC
ncbi:hypothetical protein BDQ17DRAFT_1332204 [Cyathus striatus]|nr:hypothetical protein BDQ17DRAFT_1332204 [Cyathus striatus]